MTYQQTLDYLYAQLPMYHRIGAAAYKKDLTNTLALCTYLGHPERRFPSIHVGGTNGKGSVSHMLAAVSQAAGLKTGLYISPHYRDFRERIKIDGQYISKKRVVTFIEEHRAFIEELQPSFFELCVGMAFDHFAREGVDVAVVEVGLGGRLDSTNVITPLLSVITNISFDHVALLGDTLTEIAGEKAGIIKPGVPVVIGETHPETAPVFHQKARETGSVIYFADKHFQAEEAAQPTPERTTYRIFQNKSQWSNTLELDAAGPFQAQNLATVLQAVEVLAQISPLFEGILLAPSPREGTGGRPPSYPLSPTAAFPAKTERVSGVSPAIAPWSKPPSYALRASAGKPWTVQNGLSNLRSLTRFMGRWQVIGHRPTVLCDSAHNEAGLRLAFGRIAELDFARLHVVTGFVNDKDVDGVLGLFPSTARYYFAKANIPRGLDAGELREKAGAFGLHGRAYASVRHALRAARWGAEPDDLIVVIGSIFVVAEVI